MVGTYLLMVLGAYTSAIGAGLSCPDWPTCYGTWLPFLQPDVVAGSPYSVWQIAAEWTHRALAMLVGVLILATAIAAWQLDRRPLIVRSAGVAVVLLPLQVLLGRLTVTASLQPIIVTSHLATAILILLSLTTATLSAWIYDRSMLDGKTPTLPG